MSPISKSVIPTTWIRKLSTAVDHPYSSDGNSSSYSSAEDSHRFNRQLIPSFMMNDDSSGRSYVDPWDMENYTFLRKQLQNVNISDNELSPAFETSQSDFYYVPLDNNGSPQYQYKHHVDTIGYKDGYSLQSFKDDVHGLVANIDEYDFCNDYLDTTFSMFQNEEPFLGFSNPSRQSERSRFNNQDYHTYTPPSIIKDTLDTYMPSQICKLRRRASAVTFRPNIYMNDFMNNDSFSLYNSKNGNKDYELWETGKKSLADVKIKLNRRKSFHDVSENSDVKFSKQERRKSFLDHPRLDKWKTLPVEIPEHQTTEKFEKKKSIPVISTEPTKKPSKTLKDGILLNPETKGSRTGLNVSFNSDTKLERKPSRANSNYTTCSSLAYVYEAAKRRRKMFLPSISPKIFCGDDFRYSQPLIQDAFSLDPIEQYLHRPSSRYTMTNYGHLKIDYSCSWNYLDKCIAQRAIDSMRDVPQWHCLRYRKFDLVKRCRHHRVSYKN